MASQLQSAMQSNHGGSYPEGRARETGYKRFRFLNAE
jgi:hypothetical protein